jgi:hypothetical protein
VPRRPEDYLALAEEAEEAAKKVRNDIARQAFEEAARHWRRRAEEAAWELLNVVWLYTCETDRHTKLVPSRNLRPT